MLGNHALKVGCDPDSEKCPPLADDAVGERNPAFGVFPSPASLVLRCLSVSGRRAIPSAISRSKPT